MAARASLRPRLPDRPMRLLWIALGVLLVATPGASAGSVLELTDPAGDVGLLPCAPAADITSVTAAWHADGIELTYRYVDLGAMEPAMLVQDLAGRCMYHYTEFEATIGGESFEDAVYFDHSSNPAFATGWRFYLHERDTPLVGDVDVAGDRITVFIPDEALGDTGVGDTFRILRIQSTTSLAGAGIDYESDRVPDSGECVCTLTHPGGAAAAVAVSSTGPASIERSTPAVSPWWLTPFLLVGVARRLTP